MAGISQRDYTNHIDPFKNELKKLPNKNSTTSAEEWLQDYISGNKGNTDWKELLIRQDLIGATVNGLEFKNGFEPNAPWADTSSYTAIYTNTYKRTVSGELYTFALAVALERKNQAVEYHSSSEENYLDANGFPHRYLTFNGNDIGFKDGAFILRQTIDNLSCSGNERCNYLRELVL